MCVLQPMLRKVSLCPAAHEKSVLRLAGGKKKRKKERNTYFTGPWEEARRAGKEVEEMKSSSVEQWC